MRRKKRRERGRERRPVNRGDVGKEEGEKGYKEEEGDQGKEEEGCEGDSEGEKMTWTERKGNEGSRQAGRESGKEMELYKT